MAAHACDPSSQEVLARGFLSLGSAWAPRETLSQKTLKSREEHSSELVFHIKWQLQPIVLWFLQAMKFTPMG